MKYILLLLTLILSACSQTVTPTKTLSSVIESPSQVISRTQVSPPFPSQTATLAVSPALTPTLIHIDQSIIDIPIATPVFNEQCTGAYPTEIYPLSWAVDDAIKTLDSNAEGWVEGIVQSCNDNEGKTYSTVFGMWFYIDKPTSDIKDYESFGLWIVDVMNFLDTIPRGENNINAEPTTVFFRFYTGATETLDIRVPVKQYQIDANGKSATDIFLLFYSEP